MKILYSKKFLKHFKRCSEKILKQFQSRMSLLNKNPSLPILRNHPLIGCLNGYFAFSVTGDYRVVYRIMDQNSIKLNDIGSRS